MFKWQKNYLGKRQSDLIAITSRSPGLLADLECGSFSFHDIQEVKSQSTLQDQANKLYNIAKTKPGSYDELTILFIAHKMTGPLEIFLEGYEEHNEPIPVEWTFAPKSAADEERFWKLAARSIKIKLHNEEFKLEEILSGDGHVNTYRFIYDFVKANKDRHPVRLFKEETTPKQIQELTYISRELSIRNKIKKEMFAADELPTGHTFLFRGVNNLEQLDEISDNKHHADYSSNQLREVNVPLILLKNEGDFETICNNRSDAVHLIEWKDSTDSYLWIRSGKATESIPRNMLEEKCVTSPEKDLFAGNETISSPRVISIADSAGIGKSTLLKNLAGNFKNDKTIALFVDGEKFADKHLKGIGDNESVALESLIEYVCTNECSIKIFKVLIGVNFKIKLFFDAYEDLTEQTRNQIDRFITGIAKSTPYNLQVFVATRGYLRTKLEEVLKFVTYKLRPLNLEEQEKILAHFWIKRHTIGLTDSLKRFGQKCLYVLAKELADFENEITGFPLHCKHLAKVFSNDALRTLQNQIVTEVHAPLILDLYEDIVKYKFTRIEEDLWEKYILYHVQAAIKSHFRDLLASFENHISNTAEMEIDETTVYSLGLIEEGALSDSPKFVHVTFANYFVSNYLVQNLSEFPDCMNFIIKNILTESQCSAMSTFINMHLEKHSTPNTISVKISELSSSEISTALKFCCKHNLKYCFELLSKCLMSENKKSFKWRVVRESCFKSLPHLAIESSFDFQFVQNVMSFTKQEFIADLRYYAKDPKDYVSLYPWVDDFTPVHTAIQLGKYNIVLSFKKEYEDQMKSLNLMHFCVEESDKDKDEVISGKCRIMVLLKKLNPNCLNERVSGRLPHTCINVHPKLIDKLKELGADIHADSA